MEVTVNQQNYTVLDDCNVQALLSDVLGQSGRGIAVAINEKIVPRSQWETRNLTSGDILLIIKATQGG